jgi:hypothetical protein
LEHWDSGCELILPEFEDDDMVFERGFVSVTTGVRGLELIGVDTVGILLYGFLITVDAVY